MYHFIILSGTVLRLVAQLCLTLCDPMDCSPPGSSVHGDSPGKNTGVGFYALLQGIFSIQGSNPGLPRCSEILYCTSHFPSQGPHTVGVIPTSLKKTGSERSSDGPKFTQGYRHSARKLRDVEGVACP